MMRVFGKGWVIKKCQYEGFLYLAQFYFKLVLYIVISWKILTLLVSLEIQYFLSSRPPAYNYEKDYK